MPDIDALAETMAILNRSVKALANILQESLLLQKIHLEKYHDLKGEPDDRGDSGPEAV